MVTQEPRASSSSVSAGGKQKVESVGAGQGSEARGQGGGGGGGCRGGRAGPGGGGCRRSAVCMCRVCAVCACAQAAGGAPHPTRAPALSAPAPRRQSPAGGTGLTGAGGTGLTGAFDRRCVERPGPARTEQPSAAQHTPGKARAGGIGRYERDADGTCGTCGTHLRLHACHALRPPLLVLLQHDAELGEEDSQLEGWEGGKDEKGGARVGGGGGVQTTEQHCTAAQAGARWAAQRRPPERRTGCSLPPCRLPLSTATGNRQQAHTSTQPGTQHPAPSTQRPAPHLLQRKHLGPLHNVGDLVHCRQEEVCVCVCGGGLGW